MHRNQSPAFATLVQSQQPARPRNTESDDRRSPICPPALSDLFGGWGPRIGN